LTPHGREAGKSKKWVHGKRYPAVRDKRSFCIILGHYVMPARRNKFRHRVGGAKNARQDREKAGVVKPAIGARPMTGSFSGK